jgi:hypothetical protein
MPATTRGYAGDDAESRTRFFTPHEEDAVALFLEKTDHLLAAVIASLIVCVWTIAFAS